MARFARRIDRRIFLSHLNETSVFTLMTAEGRIFKPLSVGFEMPEPSHTRLSPGMRSPGVRFYAAFPRTAPSTNRW